MLERVRAVRKSESGFTLTELLITIVILGVLAGIVVFAVASFAEDGQQVACETDRKNVEIAAEAFHARNDRYPVGVDNTARIAELVASGHLREAPSEDNYIITLDDLGAVGPASCIP